MPSSEHECDDEPTSAEPLLEIYYEATTAPPHRRNPSSRKCQALTSTVLFILGVVSLSLWILRGEIQKSKTHGVCQQPAVRREWRTLSTTERFQYLRAVKCLSSIPSTISKGTLHDEFAYIHQQVGDYSHQAAPFLPWHRYFIHIYEQTLKQRCGYEGTLPFWDWALDWKNLTQAPVWDATQGFGGNGAVDSTVTVGHGRCVQDGPFAHLQLQYYNNDWRPHCLSRGFIPAELQEHFGAQRLNSSAMAAVMDEPDYYKFLMKLEEGPHSAIPITVRGDFSRFTAPNDPIFFLHHAQIDRLWWTWQTRDLKARAVAYNGPSSHGSSAAAQLNDLIEMVAIAPRVLVRSVMVIDNELLCYRYDS